MRLFALSTRPVRGCHRSMSPSRRQTATLSQSLTGPAVFFSLFLPSYLLRHTLCLPPCDLSCERGTDRRPGDAALDTNVDIRTRWHRWETVFMCVCVLAEATSTQTPSCGLWERRGHLGSVVFVLLLMDT